MTEYQQTDFNLWNIYHNLWKLKPTLHLLFFLGIKDCEYFQFNVSNQHYALLYNMDEFFMKNKENLSEN